MYGDDLALGFLIGSRARTTPSHNAPYDVALFFRNMADREIKQVRLDDICTDMLENDNAAFNLFLFNLPDYEHKESLRRSLTKSGLCFIDSTSGAADKFSAFRKMEQVLSCTRLVCLNICVAERSDSGHEAYAIAVANVVTGQSRSWIIILSEPAADVVAAKKPSIATEPHDHSERYCVDDCPAPQPVNRNGVKIDGVFKEMNAFIGHAKTLADNYNAVRGHLQKLHKLAKTAGIYTRPDSFHDAAWDLACAFSSQPETLLCKTEAAVPECPSGIAGAEASVRRNAEVLRQIAGIALFQENPTLSRNNPNARNAKT
jgi:hypothetical protein